MVQHEEASAKVQRQIIEWRRVELHKIFSEELEEATRMGEIDRNTAEDLQHEYFDCQVRDFFLFQRFLHVTDVKNMKHFKHVIFLSLQDHLEEVLDVVLANQRYVLAERHAQRKFLVHSLHSLNSLISDTFSFTSGSLDNWFSHIKRSVLNCIVNSSFINLTFNYLKAQSEKEISL